MTAYFIRMLSSFQLYDNWIKFPLELLIAVVLFTYWLPRREHFAARISFLTLAMFGFSLVWNLNPIAGFWNVLQYLFIFMLSIVLIFFSYKCSFWHAIYAGISAYALQHIANGFHTLVAFYIPVLFSGSDSYLFLSNILNSTIYQICSYLCSYAIIYTIIYYSLAKKIKQDGFYGIDNKTFSFFISILLIFVIILNYFRVYYNDAFSRENIIINITISLYSIIGCLFALLIISGFNQQSRLNHSLEVTKQLIHMQKKQYQMSEETINLINIKCHDLKHQISAVRKNISDKDSRDALKEVEAATNIYDSVVKTKNETVNIILTEKSLLCEQNHIQLTCMIDEKNLSLISVTDLYSMLGNILDNAIEAVLKIPDYNQRVISLSISSAHNMLLIHCENYYQSNLTFQDGLPVSDKGNPKYHGYGMKSLKYLCEKYHGNLSILAEDDIFYLDILIPVVR